MEKDWREKYKSQEKYDAENTIRTNIKFNIHTDADILKALDDSGNKAGFIKEAIRFYIANKK